MHPPRPVASTRPRSLALRMPAHLRCWPSAAVGYRVRARCARLVTWPGKPSGGRARAVADRHGRLVRGRAMPNSLAAMRRTGHGQGPGRGSNRLLLTVHRHLRVVTLLEAFGAGLHDGTVGGGEIALRLVVGLPIGALVRLAALGIALPHRAATARIVRLALRRLQARPRFREGRLFAARIAANRSSRRRNSSGSSLRRVTGHCPVVRRGLVGNR